MTRAARYCARPIAQACAARRSRSVRAGWLLACFWAAAAAPLRAEIAGSLSIANDDRFRGQSVSDGRPIATATLSYDDARGPYVGGSTTVVLTEDDGLQPLRQIVYGGYAQRVTGELTVDVGATARRYSRHSSAEYARRFNEFYVGLVTPKLALRVYFSPNYDGLHGSAAYAELNGLLFTKENWSLSGHVGLLSPPRDGELTQPDPEADWRLGLTRRFGRLGVSVSWVGATPEHDSDRWRGGILLTVDRSF